ncbi:hypothetical protein Z517_04761 [Fonsecaea pedrosoi CBS 271.37]|uniref:ATPase AAA-type core domain-containing protein n=1 Tax=Fonsecaea pedrosoi CBS 271.37 TaxID=1442368 RepID=A0A0D2GT39_9EURO|nr:uncharacterized protein Z517_04761 [Fonsecaea pedrosoi CBS 271.37]KIW81735.1 hypothetical protein Z517_04761 [Fonsecaea pedrosoi CBS 271.37]
MLSPFQSFFILTVLLSKPPARDSPSFHLGLPFGSRRLLLRPALAASSPTITSSGSSEVFLALVECASFSRRLDSVEEVEYIADVQWNTKAFQNLVTEEDAKDLLEALSTNQLKIETLTDLIVGKGTGLIVLEYGGLGTGETCTAESVADYAQKPLYRVTCRDIGTEPVEVEKYLETVLRLGHRWSCVVLLDDADIFLEERTLADLRRNALVSVRLPARPRVLQPVLKYAGR